MARINRNRTVRHDADRALSEGTSRKPSPSKSVKGPKAAPQVVSDDDADSPPAEPVESVEETTAELDELQQAVDIQRIVSPDQLDKFERRVLSLEANYGPKVRQTKAIKKSLLAWEHDRPKKLNAMRQRGDIHALRDGTSWKFKMEELERVAEEHAITLVEVNDEGLLEVADLGPTGASELVFDLDADEAGESSTAAGKSPAGGRPKASAAADSKLGPASDGGRQPEEDSQLSLASEYGGSNVHLGGGSDVMGGTDLGLQSGSGELDFEGSGLGLALARRIVLLHGGDIYLRSDPGHGPGTVFTIRLSIVRAEGASRPTTPVSPNRDRDLTGL